MSDSSRGGGSRSNVSEIEGHGIVVVGGAAGIGRAAAGELVRRGARIAVVDRDTDGANAAAAELGGSAFAADVTAADEVEAAVAGAEETLGRIHALVNCAGITGQTNVRSHEVAVDDFDDVYRVNLRGAFLLSRAVIPRMLPHAYGRVLHVASIAGKEGNAGMVSYSATKAGMIGMVKSQGKEYAETGITVNALAPAVIRTGLVDAMPEAQVEYMTSRIPMRRCGELAEAAEMIAWIVSPACSFTTGFTFDLSGGRATY
jgi:2-dehydro-3-deoxy-L-rhamnonate dehydrogenase (NAD+)